MKWVSQNCVFPQLRTLDVYLSRNDMMDEKPGFSEQAASSF